MWGFFLCQDEKSDGSDDEDEDDKDKDEDDEDGDEDDEDGDDDEAMEEEEEAMEEGEVDQSFRLELMKVLQQQNALVGFQVFSRSFCQQFVCSSISMLTS